MTDTPPSTTPGAGKLTAWEQEQAARLRDPDQPTTAPARPAREPERPPLGGPGSGRDAWAAYVTQLGGTVDDDLTRDELVEQADHLEVEAATAVDSSSPVDAFPGPATATTVHDEGDGTG